MALRNSDSSVQDAAQTLDGHNWSLDLLNRSAEEDKTTNNPDFQEQLFACSSVIMKNLQQTASFNQESSTILFKDDATPRATNTNLETLRSNKHKSKKKSKAKKKSRQPEKWKVSIRKEATISGKEHISKSGKLIKAKSLKPGCSCRKMCTTKIEPSARQKIFNNYWNEMKTWDMKHQFVLSHVTRDLTVRHRPKDETRAHLRRYTIKYDLVYDDKKIDVCKTFFLNTLGISESVVSNVLKNQLAGGFVSSDQRGRHRPPNKLSEDKKNKEQDTASSQVISNVTTIVADKKTVQ